MRMSPFVVVAGLLAGCASQPAGPELQNPVPTVQQALVEGYRVVNEGGQTLYCRDQLMTGSHMRKETICLTEEQRDMAREASRRNLEQMQQRLPPPQGT